MDVKHFLTVLGIIAFGLGACIPAPITAPTLSQGYPAGTAVAETFEAFQTESAHTLIAMQETLNAVTETTLIATPSSSPEPSTPTSIETTSTVSTAAQATSTPSGSPQPSTQTTPTSTGTPTPTFSGSTDCDWASFVTDVTIPDGTVLNPGEKFTKTWRLRNRGSCTWTTDYQLVFHNGTQFGEITVVNLPNTVAPQQTVDISVSMTAPDAGGHFYSYWMMRNSLGDLFGYGANADRPVYVEINTNSSYAAPTGNVTVMVSVDTNCRSGPGAVYTYLGVLLIGEIAEVIGRNQESTYWIINNPDIPGSTCWLWGQYASVSGNISGLPVYSSPGWVTPLASGVRVSVWVDTNCRSGPGLAYTYLGVLLVGESAEVLGRNPEWTYWVIRNPDQPGGTCWLWGQYATLNGNPGSLPVYSTPNLLAATAIPTTSGAIRISFETGSIGTTIKADLPENKLHTYVLRAEAGQTMTVQLTSKWDLLLSISGADGSVLKSSGIVGNEWSGVLPKSQDYYLTIQAVDGLAASYSLQIVIPAK